MRVAARPPPKQNWKMSHQLIGWLILLAAFAFVVFAFRQGRRVKHDPNKRQDDWQRTIPPGWGDS
jgi:hypothetical protein